ncbi:MAG: hypothetical protein U9P00_10210 [Pseudomonadota bacterium]|nr:hypothetical protein [Pseudomonadota bacterium]
MGSDEGGECSPGAGSTHVNWGIRIRRECLSGFFLESPEAHVSLFLDMDPVPSQRRKRKS